MVIDLPSREQVVAWGMVAAAAVVVAPLPVVEWVAIILIRSQSSSSSSDEPNAAKSGIDSGDDGGCASYAGGGGGGGGSRRSRSENSAGFRGEPLVIIIAATEARGLKTGFDSLGGGAGGETVRGPCSRCGVLTRASIFKFESEFMVKKKLSGWEKDFLLTNEK